MSSDGQPPAHRADHAATIAQLESLRTRINYNSHDFGEFGQMVRLEYVHNFIDELVTKLKES